MNTAQKILIPLAAMLLVTACQQQTDDPAAATAESAEPSVTQAPPVSSTPDVQEVAADPGPLPTISSASEPEDSPYREIIWDDLMPEDYRPEVLLAKYMDQIADLEDDDPKAMEIYGQMQAEFENAPINEKLNRQMIKLPGFIAPLESSDEKVHEFLLVPYYGACIHVPPPPVNQTVLVRTLEQHSLTMEDIYDPIWVKGELLTEGKKTDIGQAGYRIVDAQIEPYSG